MSLSLEDACLGGAGSWPQHPVTFPSLGTPRAPKDESLQSGEVHGDTAQVLCGPERPADSGWPGTIHDREWEFRALDL